MVDLAVKRRASYDLKGCNDDKTLELDGERINEVGNAAVMIIMLSSMSPL